jgi:DNA-binding NarL/FixJ family response regulator
VLASGETNREVARVLFMSLSTVKTHAQRIISKLGVSDRTQAAVRAIEQKRSNRGSSSPPDPGNVPTLYVP